MKRLVSFFLLILISFSLAGCQKTTCNECYESFDSSYAYCPSCGAKQIESTYVTNKTQMSNEEKIIGTWIYVDGWGNFTYTFYSDGSCQGQYIGDVGNVYPSLNPRLSDYGSGDGHWSFVDNKLKIEYSGKYEGSQYYDYSFNENSDLLTINNEIIWSKFPDDSTISANHRLMNLKILDNNNNLLSQCGILGVIVSRAEVINDKETNTYRVRLILTDFGQEELSRISDEYTGSIEFCINDESFYTTSINHKITYNVLNLPCYNLSYKDIQLIAYRFNQTAIL